MNTPSIIDRGDYLLKRFNKVIFPIDVYTARYLATKAVLNHESVFDVTVLLGIVLRLNQVSLSIDDVNGKSFMEIIEQIMPGVLESQSRYAEVSGSNLSLTSRIELDPNHEMPDFKAIQLNHLLESGVVCEISGATEPTELSEVGAPLVKHGNWIYFRRQWVSEWYVLDVFRNQLEVNHLVTDESYVETVSELFYDTHGKTSGQIQAVLSANKHALSIVTGGPGTGKTRTIVGFLASVLKYKPESRVVLCAPTGKAASRMVESIRDALDSSQELASYTSLIPQKASTIHRLLGWNPSAGVFIHHEKNPIRADILIVDEASMIDLVMFSRLMRAVPKSCRMIMLGDKDQLSSVEAGSVFGDLVRAGLGEQNSHLSNIITRLTHSWRFKSESGLGLLAEMLNKGDEKRSWEMIQSTSEYVKLMSSNYMDFIMNLINSLH